MIAAGVLSTAFLAQNLHFAINLFVALSCFAAGWLYLDADDKHHPIVKTSRWAGFFLLAVGFLLTGAGSGPGSGLVDTIATLIKLAGYTGIIISNFLEPIQPRPVTTGLLFSNWRETNQSPPPSASSKATLPLGLTLPALQLSLLLPLGSLLAGILYWRRATTGLERHLKGIAVTFSTLALADIIAASGLWTRTDNPILQQLAAPLGPAWTAGHLVLLAAGLILMRWVWRYLTKRPQTQLFLFVTTLAAGLVLTVTVAITGLLLINLQKASLASLETAAKVLKYAIDGKTSDTRANTQIVAQTPAVVTATAAGDHAALASRLQNLLTDQDVAEIIITGRTGQILARASDPDRYGDSLSANSLVKRALAGDVSSTIASAPGAVTPSLTITTASPIYQNNAIIGAALSSQVLDNAFVDGIKQTTGLDSTVFSQSTRTATTLTAPNGTTRLVGAKESSKTILKTTLDQGRIWQGAATISNQPYLAIYLPLKDIDNSTVGMLAVAQAQTLILETSNQAVRLTFLVAVICLLAIILPVYYVCRTIARQLH